MNPFKIPRSGNDAGYTPLNPLIHIEHENYYAPVDNTEKAFLKYKAYVESLNNSPGAHTVVIHGETGCGKTSLTNRCAKLLKDTSWEINDEDYEFRVIDLRDLKLTPYSSQQKIDEILDHLTLIIEVSDTIPKDLRDNFGDKASKGASVALNYLSFHLNRVKVNLIILFPNVETNEDLKQYLDVFHQNNWILFFETENLEVVKYGKRFKGKNIMFLEVNPLKKPEDANKFIRKRLSIAGNGKIDFEKDALKEYILVRQRKSGASIREIQTVCEKVYGEAMETKKKTIGFTDVAKIAMVEFLP